MIVLFVGTLAAGLNIASADDRQDSPETFITRLDPGDNLVGWTEHSEQVESLFEAIPQIQHVWVWDADRNRWRFAAPGMPRHLWTLETLTPGMGLKIWLEGNTAVDWQRPRRPAQGTVRLSPGYNLVAWMGRDSAPLERLIRGIGQSLLQVGLQSNEVGGVSFSLPDTIATEQDQQHVDFGQAMWIEVSRPVNWLQPTGVHAELVISSQASTALQRQIRDDLSDVLDFYWQEYGLEPDFTLYTIYVPATFNDWVEMLIPDVPNRDKRVTQALNSPQAREGWKSFGGLHGATRSLVTREIYVKRDIFRNSSRSLNYGRSVLLHEVAHAIHRQLPGIREGPSDSVPVWVSEGIATYMEHHFQQSIGHAQWRQLEANAWSDVRREPALEEQELAGGDPYVLGLAAMYLLVSDAPNDNLFELFRQMVPAGIGPNGRWSSASSWERAFDSTFAIDLPSFYQEFTSNRAQAAGAGSFHLHEHVPPLLTGRLTMSADSEHNSADVRVQCFVEDGTLRLQGSTLVSNAGRFETPVEPNSKCVITVDLTDPPCRSYYADGGLTTNVSDARVFDIGRSIMTGLRIQVPADPCPFRVEGVLQSATGEQLPGLRLSMHEFLDDGSGARLYPGFAAGEPYLTTAPNGSFSFGLPSPADRGLSVTLQALCDGRANAEGTALGTQWGETISKHTLRDPLTITIPDDLCTHHVGGRVFDSDGQGIANAQVNIQAAQGGGNLLTQTRSDGVFRLVAPSAGAHRLYVSRLGCSLYYTPDQAVASPDRAAIVQVDDDDVSGLKFTWPDGACSTAISGRLLDVEGNGLANATVYAGRHGSAPNAQTGADGSFAITVPEPGPYRIRTILSGCSIYYQEGGVTTSPDQATTIAIDKEDVEGLRFALPADVCSTTVGGRLLDAEGNAISNVWVRLQPESGTGSGALTDSDGTYSIPLPEPGRYRVSTQVNGCSVYFSQASGTGSYHQATLIQFTNSDISDISLQLAKGMCERYISGVLLNAYCTPRRGQWVHAAGGAGSGGAPSGADGSFKFALPERGSYRLQTRIDGCLIYRGSSGSTTDWTSASEIEVSDSDVAGVVFRLTENPATFCD